MLRHAAYLVFVALFTLTAGCYPDPDGDQKAKVQPPGQACICARACGVPIIDNSYRVTLQGKPVPLGFCPPLHDEIIYENRARCQCGAAAGG